MKQPSDIVIGINVDKSNATKEFGSYVPAYRQNSPVFNRPNFNTSPFSPISQENNLANNLNTPSSFHTTPLNPLGSIGTYPTKTNKMNY